MLLRLSSYYLKIGYYILRKPHGNHKGKTCSRYTKGYDKESKHSAKKSHQFSKKNIGREEERSIGSTEQLENNQMTTVVLTYH